MQLSEIFRIMVTRTFTRPLAIAKICIYVANAIVQQCYNSMKMLLRF